MSSFCIAVVEDNPDNRLLLQAILSDFDIEEYADGILALAAWQSTIPDLILLDVSLPHMDGTEVLGHIRRDERLRSVPVIALTAHAMSGDREKYLSMGFNAYVTKPIIDETVLIGEIRRLLERP